MPKITLTVTIEDALIIRAALLQYRSLIDDKYYHPIAAVNESVREYYSNKSNRASILIDQVKEAQNEAEKSATKSTRWVNGEWVA
jgi:hypothetical protein